MGRPCIQKPVGWSSIYGLELIADDEQCIARDWLSYRTSSCALHILHSADGPAFTLFSLPTRARAMSSTTLSPLVSGSHDLPPPSKTASLLRSLLPSSLQHPLLAIVCGTGLAGLADLLEERVDLPYERIGFPSSTVVGHKSKLSFGKLRGVPVVAQAGRFHFYEGKPLSLVTYPIKVFQALGCKAAIRELEVACRYCRARLIHGG